MQSKWIEGYEGLYAVTDDARIISYAKYKDGYVLTPHKNKNGYLTVELLGKEVKVHQLWLQMVLCKITCLIPR